MFCLFLNSALRGFSPLILRGTPLNLNWTMSIQRPASVYSVSTEYLVQNRGFSLTAGRKEMKQQKHDKNKN